MINKLDAKTLKEMMISASNHLENHKQEINELNVFPVPDGDTGTNMSLTMSAAKKELLKGDPQTVSEVSKIISNSLLRGARGNSGVILSLIFRGFSKALKGLDVADSLQFAEGLQNGVEAAYSAVMKPTEGTILTVARFSANIAYESALEEEDVLLVLEKTIESAKETLDRTPDMLAVLKQANVVDAGGKGLVVIYEGAYEYLKTGKIIPLSEGKPEESAKNADFTALSTEDIHFAYCTEFIILNKNEKDSISLQAYLESIGDCVVVVSDEEIIKVHVHTNDPGDAITRAISIGPITNIKIDNMKQQHMALSESTQAEEHFEPEPEEEKRVAPEKDYGFVVVAAGGGISEVFYDLGVDIVIEGGQTMNPSTHDILKAVYKTPAKTVFVFPNNKNIIMAAQQAVPLCDDRKIEVIETKSIPQGISAMLNFDPTASQQQNKEAMSGAIDMVKTAQITFAARDSVFDEKKIKEGQILGLVENKLSVVGNKIEKVIVDLIKNTDIAKTGEIMTIFYGADVKPDEAEKVLELLKKTFGEQYEFALVNGKQPVYQYIISIE